MGIFFVVLVGFVFGFCILLCFFPPLLPLSWIVKEQSLPFSLLSICDPSQGKEISTEFGFVGFLLYMELHLTSTPLFSEDIYSSRM